MSNSYFEFKRFIIRHDRCAMKVGTDGVLLGAWADVSKAKRVLDVGTGTGLVALMIAQRSDAEIYAVEIDSNAVSQACENVSCSPWAERITVRQGDFRMFYASAKFDIIVSNPPYFVGSLESPDRQRSIARHTGGLTFYELISKAATLLSPDGELMLIIPSDAEECITEIALGCQLFPIRRTYVQTTSGASPKRLLISLSFIKDKCVTDTLAVELSRHVYSQNYINLTKDYYMKM